METAWVANLDSNGGWPLRWQWADSELHVMHHLDALRRCHYGKPTVRCFVSNRRLMLFDSAVPGACILSGAEPCLEFDAPADDLLIDTLIYKPDPSLSLVVHRIQPETMD